MHDRSALAKREASRHDSMVRGEQISAQPAGPQKQPKLSNRRVLFRKILSGAALLGCGSALRRQARAQEFYAPNLNSCWIHGSALRIQGPGSFFPFQYGGWVGVPPWSSAWIHFSVSTPVIVDKRRVRIDSVAFFFTMYDCTIRAMHVWDGYARIANYEPLWLDGHHRFERFLVPGSPYVWNGIDISVLVRNDHPNSASCYFPAAGVDFV